MFGRVMRWVGLATVAYSIIQTQSDSFGYYLFKGLAWIKLIYLLFSFTISLQPLLMTSRNSNKNINYGGTTMFLLRAMASTLMAILLCSSILSYSKSGCQWFQVFLSWFWFWFPLLWTCSTTFSSTLAIQVSFMYKSWVFNCVFVLWLAFFREIYWNSMLTILVGEFLCFYFDFWIKDVWSLDGFAVVGDYFLWFCY